ncbi:hypothetical protein K7432_000910 [Basidiobolus ranarum]|uniref:protein O-GlcNAc transferase n=1 Tax=Basidiobolus ranarum TaxID=34480 RepID=A0ABR2WAI3_9FUNG
MLIQQNDFANFFSNDQPHYAIQKVPPSDYNESELQYLNCLYSAGPTTRRNFGGRHMSFPFSGSTSTIEVPKFGEVNAQPFRHLKTHADLIQSYPSHHSNNTLHMNTTRDRLSSNNTNMPFPAPSFNNRHSISTGLSINSQSTRSYPVNQNAPQQTWKDRKDPYSNKPTSTLVDFECISPPPPPKKPFFASDQEPYHAKQSSRHVQNSDSFPNHTRIDPQLFRRNSNINDQSIGKNKQIRSNKLSRESHTYGPSFNKQLPTQMLPSYIPSYNQENYGHFMATAANLVDPWIDTSTLFGTAQSNLANDPDFQHSGIPRGDYQPSFQHMMLPPPSPTILLYYQQDPAYANFNGNHLPTHQPNPNIYHLHDQNGGHSYNSSYLAGDSAFGYSHPTNVRSHQTFPRQNDLFLQSTTYYPNTSNQYDDRRSNGKVRNQNYSRSELNSIEPSQIRYLPCKQPNVVGLYNVNSATPNENHFVSNHCNGRCNDSTSSTLCNTSSHFSGIFNTKLPFYDPLTSHGPHVVPGTRISVVDARSKEIRDQILAHAHNLYSSAPKDSNLLPMLHCLHELHPKHLPVLLLLACVYFSRDDIAKSLYYNSKILEIDPNYVEAMSNIGTTLRSTGRCSEAENWWWRAIKLRPGYWDAIENLLGVLCNQHAKNPQVGTSKQSRYKEAMEVCNFVESHVFSKVDQSAPLSPKNLGIAIIHTPRVQNLLYTKGNLLYAMGDCCGAKKEYERALEIVFGGCTLVEVVASIAQTTGISTIEKGNLATLPMLLLAPEQAVQLCNSIFAKSDGILPGLTNVHEQKTPSYVPSTTSRQQINQTCSNILLTLAKLYQDKSSSAPLQMLLPLYYLSLSLYPSPSTCNNLGILLSTVGVLAPTSNCPTPLNGPALAYQYYTYGLSLDSQHPHLYTNLGSLLKDMGRLPDAVRMYEKAVECNPRFDIALANLGNAIKDMGRVQDSVQWYMRAVEVNPDFGEAICGLVNALGGVCDWRGRGGPANCVVELEKGAGGILVRSQKKGFSDPSGWMMDKVSRIVDKQLTEGLEWGREVVLRNNAFQDTVVDMISNAFGVRCLTDTLRSKIADWIFSMSTIEGQLSIGKNDNEAAHRNEGSWLVRIVERCMRIVQRRWYVDQYKCGYKVSANEAVNRYQRPTLPPMSAPSAPTVLPFHTFTYPLSPRQIRLISHRNAIRISHSVLNYPWLPATVYPPPAPPSPLIKIGYVSSDFNNHPLSHLMQSVFGLHDHSKFMVYCYATTPDDQSPYRAKIEQEAQVFLNVSTWSTQAITERIVQDGIHILINLNGYTKGARNEVFAARPAPILMAYMGFAGSLGAGWCDYLISDPIVCPPELVACERWRMHNEANEQVDPSKESDCNDIDELEGISIGDMDPEEISEEWVYTEKMIYMPHSYFVNDHRQGFRDEDGDAKSTSSLAVTCSESLWRQEQKKRWIMRREVFPHLHDNMVIFANFNQLYKIDPSIFKVWLRILSRVPNSILWLLRFPAAGETHLLRTAEEYAGKEVASRVIFTDVAPKSVHIHRGRVADLFLDTPECNGHTTGCDILWSGTPILTFPRHRHKLCSRVAASIAYATGHGDKMVVSSELEYEDIAVKYAQDLSYEYVVDNESQLQQPHQMFEFLRGITQQQLQSSFYRIGRGILMDLRRDLFLKRDNSPLFDTPRWVRNLEKGYLEAWRRWDSGEEFTPKGWSCIWVNDVGESVHR